MEKKIILCTLFFVLNAQLLSAQLMSEYVLFWELYQPERSISFADSLTAIKWPENEFAYRIKHEHLNINNQELIFSYVSGCSGLPCMYVNCFKEQNNKWFFSAQAHIMMYDGVISAHYDEKYDVIVFSDESNKEIGTIKMDYLSGNRPVLDSEETNILLSIGSEYFTIDLENNIKFKIDSEVIPFICNSDTSSLIFSEYGNIYKKGQSNNVLIKMCQKISKSLTIGYYNPSSSDNYSKIVCEQRIYRKDNCNKMLKCDIVELYIDSKVIKTIGKGYRPQYSKNDGRYILYQEGKYFYVFDNNANKELLRFHADSAKFF